MGKDAQDPPPSVRKRLRIRRCIEGPRRALRLIPSPRTTSVLKPFYRWGKSRPREAKLPSRKQKPGPRFLHWRWECRCAFFLGGQSPCGSWGRSRALTVLTGVSSRRGMLDPLLPQFPQHYHWWGTGDDEIGHARACRDIPTVLRLSRRLRKPDGGSFPRATSQPFKVRPPVRASRRSIGKTLGSRTLLQNLRL